MANRPRKGTLVSLSPLTAAGAASLIPVEYVFEVVEVQSDLVYIAIMGSNKGDKEQLQSVHKSLQASIPKYVYLRDFNFSQYEGLTSQRSICL